MFDRDYDIIPMPCFPEEVPLMRNGKQIGTTRFEVREDGIHAVSTLDSGESLNEMMTVTSASWSKSQPGPIMIDIDKVAE